MSFDEQLLISIKNEFFEYHVKLDTEFFFHFSIDKE